MRSATILVSAFALLVALMAPGALAQAPSDAASARVVTTDAPLTSLTAVGAADMLYDQLDGLGSPSGYYLSENFEAANDPADSYMADEFVVPGDTAWNVTEVQFRHFYIVSAGGTYTPVPHFNVIIWEDDGGQPGAEVYRADSVATTTPPPTAVGTLALGSIELPESVDLSSGTYWLTVQANLNFAANGTRYLWYSRNGAVGATAQLFNYGGGFTTVGTCNTDWGPVNGAECGRDGTTAPSLTFAIVGTASNIYSVLTMAEARAAGAGETVTVEGTVSRAKGAFTYFQDETAGLAIRQTAGAFFDAVADGTIAEGTRIRVTGTLSEFRGLLQINAGDLDSYEVLGQDGEIAPQRITLAELAANGEAYEAELVEVIRLDTESTGTFAAAQNYTVTDATDEGVLRTPNAGDTDVDGTAIPEGEFVFTGVVGQFTFEDPADNGYQLLAIGEDDIAAPVAACALTLEPEAFASTAVGASSEITATVSNSGTGACEVTAASTEAPFAVEGFSAGAVAPDSLLTFTVTYAPTEPGEDAATLTVSTDAGDLTAGLSGEAVEAAAFSVDPDALAFTVGEGAVSESQAVTLSNAGGTAGAFTVTAIAVEPTPTAPRPVALPAGAERKAVQNPEAGPFLQTTAAADVLQDGSFEGGSPNAAWSEGSTNFGSPLCTASCGADVAYDGDWFVWFGGISSVEETGFVEQEVIIPSGTATLSFWHLMAGSGTPGFMAVTIDDTEVFRSTQADTLEYEDYRYVVLDVSDFADDEIHTLRFESSTEAGNSAANFFLDLVALNVAEGISLTVSPESGTVEADGSQEISVTVDATGAEPGTYTAQLLIETEDPENPTLTVDVTITVEPTVSNEDGAIPTTFALRSNYPNPFAASTAIEYDLPTAEHVTIGVYDALGRRVATLVDGEQAAGRHTARWNASDVASGVYLYRIQAGSYARTMKMVVAR